MKKNKKKTIKKKCKHEIETCDPCPMCGYDEGICKKCGKYVSGQRDDLEE